MTALFLLRPVDCSRIVYVHSTQGVHMSDKICDFLELCAGFAISAGFIFLAAYALVGGI